MEAKYPVSVVDEMTAQLEKAQHYEVNPYCPENKDAWLYHVFSGTKFSNSNDNIKSRSFVTKGRVDVGDGAQAEELLDMLSSEFNSSNNALKGGGKGRGGRGGGRGKQAKPAADKACVH
eukprot:15455147-Alexandrium_andersonii.AAC.1